MDMTTVFASGEAGDADAAYALADRALWIKIQAKTGYGCNRIEHNVTSRVRVTTGLDIEKWTEESREVSTVIVTLLAHLTRPTERK